jgi:hypothetical protein
MAELEDRIGPRGDAEALAHYIEAGHPYRLAMRSPIAVQWLEQGYVFFARVDDSNAFWPLAERLSGHVDKAGPVPAHASHVNTSG